MTTNEIHSELAAINAEWEAAYAAKDWSKCQEFKAYYDSLWAQWNPSCTK